MTYELIPESTYSISQWPKKGSIFARSFSRHEQKKLRYGALIGCFVIVVTLCTIFKPFLGPLKVLNLQLSMATGLNIMMSNTEEINKPQKSYSPVENLYPIIHNFSNSRTDVYEIFGDIRIHGNSSSIFVTSNTEKNMSSIIIKPYARKTDATAMGRVRNLHIINNAIEEMPDCSQNLSVPAIVFSMGGYAGNLFHDISDVLIPLYLTAQQFNGELAFLITDRESYWVSKYQVYLKKLSKFKVIDMDREKAVVCFSRVIVGLKANTDFGIDPLLSPPYTLTNFTRFLQSTYSLEREFLSKNSSSRPHYRMLIISRKKTRHLSNEREVANMARKLGFDVVVKEMLGDNVSLDAHFVNSFDVMVGVHGAGLTNMVFLPENAILIQIVPFGLDSLANHFYQLPAEGMNLRYLEYKVSINESSLLGKYPQDSEVFRNPETILMKGFPEFRKLYMDKQDVKLDLGRFRMILLTASELLCS